MVIVTTPAIRDWDDELDVYYQMFMLDASGYGLSPATVHSISKGPLAWDIAGVCVYGINAIIVNRAAWKYLNDHGRRELIYHELAHCALGMDHDESVYVIGNRLFPDIMNTELYPLWQSDSSWQARKSILFKRAKERGELTWKR